MVRSQESGGRILHCAAFLLLFVCVCTPQMNNFHKITPPVLPQCPWPLREILFDEEQNNPGWSALISWRAVSSRKEWFHAGWKEKLAVCTLVRAISFYC